MANPKMTKAWFRYAIRDLKAAKALIDLGSEHKYAAAYSAQQCAEKAIKGYLTHCNCRVPKTHDLVVLANQIGVDNQALVKFILKYKSLSDLAVVFRYPDSEKKPLTYTRAKTATEQARLIYDRCYKEVYGKLDRSKFIKQFRDE